MAENKGLFAFWSHRHPPYLRPYVWDDCVGNTWLSLISLRSRLERVELPKSIRQRSAANCSRGRTPTGSGSAVDAAVSRSVIGKAVRSVVEAYEVQRRKAAGGRSTSASARRCQQRGAESCSASSSVLAADGVVLPNTDNIHLRVWDQMKWAGAVLASLGLTPAIVNRTSLSQIASDNWSQLGYGSGSWSQAKAVGYCAAILG